MDPVTVITEWLPRVDHVHIKDVARDSRWAPTGEGVIDIPGVASLLESSGYTGWITFEDESDSARRNPDAAVLANGRYVRALAERQASTSLSAPTG